MQFSRTAFVVVSAALLAVSSAALAAEPAKVKLQGNVSLDEETCAKGTSAADCQLNFEVTGKAAKVIYDGLTGKGVLQECTGEIEKFDDSGMHCIKGKTAADYYCDFSYSFHRGEFGSGGDGC